MNVVSRSYSSDSLSDLRFHQSMHLHMGAIAFIRHVDKQSPKRDNGSGTYKITTFHLYVVLRPHAPHRDSSGKTCGIVFHCRINKRIHSSCIKHILQPLPHTRGSTSVCIRICIHNYHSSIHRFSFRLLVTPFSISQRPGVRQFRLVQC